MQRLEVSGVVRLIYRSLCVKGLIAREVTNFRTIGTGSQPPSLSRFSLYRGLVTFILTL